MEHKPSAATTLDTQQGREEASFRGDLLAALRAALRLVVRQPRAHSGFIGPKPKLKPNG
jgi:hypothetical protein